MNCDKIMASLPKKIAMSFHERFEALPGPRRGSMAYRDKHTDYLYRLEKLSHKHVYLTCIIKGCQKRASYKNNFLAMKIKHTHEPSRQEVVKLQVLNSCKDRCAREFTPIRQIFNEEMKRKGLKEGVIKFDEIEKTLYISRRAKFPRIPESTGDFVLILMSEPRYLRNLDGEPFYRDYISMSDGSECVIFGSPCMLDALQLSPDITIDIAFAKVPKPFAGLVSIHFWYRERSFPAFYCLLTKYSEIAFVETFRQIRAFVPSFAPENIVTGYDPPLQNALEEVFSDLSVRIEGSLFHYGVSLYTELNRPDVYLLDTYLHGDVEYKTVLEMCFALPLLRPDYITAGLQVLWNRWAELPCTKEKEKIKDFLTYIDAYWVNGIGAQKMSVWESPDRTSRNIEGFHKHLSKHLNTSNENVWMYLDRIKKFDQMEKQDIDRAETGGGISRKKNKRMAIMTHQMISNLYERLHAQKIDLDEFLRTASNKVKAIRS